MANFEGPILEHGAIEVEGESSSWRERRGDDVINLNLNKNNKNHNNNYNKQ